MRRREFLKLIGGLPFAGILNLEGLLFKKEIPERFWMQIYGHFYKPLDFCLDWESADSCLVGIYSGEILLGEKASNHSIGSMIIANDFRYYICFDSSNVTIRGKGVYINEA